ncbi:MAG: nucleoside kinase [Candidatus Cloacimonetes bacterium]|nr:nucleoside kinase [Candidatus Cloacimonadota bacterium]MCF7813539.1 nucleoside kinase [Candidatus Cloacimonadota bacterium]MCF7869280.1 nucleoside kinase [Candidatus Cloacimonadota bacterium]MCF7884193.1 nucleoside kinase [Candidatus Cloacimonadota bacterium]
MIKIELKINGDHHQTLTFAKPVKVQEIVDKKLCEEKKIIIHKIDETYCSSQHLIESDCTLECVSVYTTEGYTIYQDTTIFVLCKAFNNVISKEQKLVVEHSIGDGVFCEVLGYTFSPEEVEKLRKEMHSIIDSAFPIEKVSLKPDEAKELARKGHRDDFVKILKYKNIDMYRCGDYYDYFLRQLAENTSFATNFEIFYQSPGIILRFPHKGDDEITTKFRLPRKLFSTHQEHDKWLNILDMHTVSALNRAVQNYTIKDLIHVEEALHEKKIVDIASEIHQNDDIKLILIAGPSSSGKTTFAKRLAIQLRVNGIHPIIVGLDDYFLPRSLTPRKNNGDFDFENIQALDLPLLNEDLKTLMSGLEIELPKFNFITGNRDRSYHNIKLGKENVIILEGIHGLNDILTSSVPFNQKMRIYVSALNNLNIDAHNRIPTTDSRKIRRLVRDHNFRNHSAEQTLCMWDDIRDGEDHNIFPFQENADFMFNSILTYELCVLKKYAKPLLKSVNKYSKQYIESRRLIRLLDHVYNVQDGLVPSNSILREFIGGSIFNY